MIYSLIHWFVSGVALKVTAAIVPGFRIKKFSSALIAALIIGLANFSIRPILIFLTFPFNIITLGLFAFVVDGMILKLCAAILRDFKIQSWMSAILSAFVLAMTGTVLHFFLI